PGDEDNTDLRDEDLHDDPEDGHVADTTETAEEEEEDDEEEDGEINEEEDADGDGGPPPLPAAGAAAAAASSAAARRLPPSVSYPARGSSAPAYTGRGSRSPSASQKRARRRTRSKSKTKSRSTSQPRGVQKNVQTNQPLSKNARKKITKALRKTYQNFFVAMPSPQNVGGASCTGANFDIFLSFNPYFMKMKGTGKANAATPPRMLIAGPTPRLLNIGLAASGRPPAIMLRKNVLAETADAA
ncbi:hypothetical protein KCU77_g17698, partial [Aureobasidium melanogenum]